MKICSASLIIREMQIKTTKYCITPARMTVIKKASVVQDVDRREPHVLVV